MIWISVALGGALGALGRYSIAHYLLPGAKGFPWSTFVANIIGCFLIGLLYVLITEKQLISEQWRPLLMTGFLGALTTYSTFALESFLLWQQGQINIAILYVVSSLVSCVLAVFLSIYVTSRLF